MNNPELKKFEETLNTIVEEKKKKGISRIYVDELIKEARAKLGYPEDDFLAWKWQGTKNHQLAFQIKDYEKIDLLDFDLKES